LTQNDHGNLYGLADDDHYQYVHIDSNRTITANHTFTNGLTISSGLLSATSGNFSLLTVNSTGVSLSGHTHTASNITDFNSSVSGLLPTIANSGDNRLLTSTGTTIGINAESNATFDGTTLTVNGTAKFNQIYPTVSGLGNVTGTVNTDASVAQIFNMTLTGNITLANPSSGVDGVTIRWRILQDNVGSRGVTLGNKFVIPSTATNPLPFSTSANVMDVLAATYHAGRDKWDIISFVPGY
jgi:hypothetical protein